MTAFAHRLDGDRLLTCPQCDHALAEPAGRCPRCRFRYDESTQVITGAATTSGEFLALVVGWCTAGLLCLSILPPPFFGLVLLAMVAHLGSRAVLGDARTQRRLVISDTGVALTRIDAPAEVLRWHLFEEARVELIAESALDQGRRAAPRWRLTLVNAYKPSISTYLHKRGTDAPIFAEAIVFTFNASAEFADELRTRLSDAIGTAARNYRALRLKQMHLVPPEPDEVLRLQQCPRCLRDLRSLPARGRCPACGEPYTTDMFTLPGRVVAAHPATVMLPAFGLILGVVYLLSGYTTPGTWLLAFGVVTAALGLVLKFLFGGPSRRAVVVTRGGLLIWEGRQLPRVYEWWQLPEHRAVQVEYGRWRVAFWDHAKHAVSFNEFFFTWRAFPPGRPVLDIVIRGDEQVGQLIAEEIERRIDAHPRARTIPSAALVVSPE